MGLFSRKKRLTKEQREELDKAREELRKISEVRDKELEQLKDMEEKRKQKTKSGSNDSTDHNLQSQTLQEEITAMEERRENEFRRKQQMFNADTNRLSQNPVELTNPSPNNAESMGCSFSGCKNKAGSLSGNQCKFCDNRYCLDHIQLERHDCVKTRHTKFLRKNWLRKYEFDISTGLYVVVCDDCGYKSEIGRLIDVAGNEREKHISVIGCDQKKVFLEQWK